MSEGIVYGDYYLLGRLSTGGMAEVFVGKRLGDAVGARLLAVKRIRARFSDDSQVVRMFEDEARIARRLHHPNICEVLDEGFYKTQLYLAMEFIHGKDLRVMSQRARKAGERLSYAVIAFVAAAIADALAYAHEQRSATGEPEPIIHRAVSPQNIVVSYDGVPKLIAFGIVKAKKRVVETSAGLVKGKYNYMSPEQVAGAPLDGRSDVFSLGTVLYELATDLQPFHATSDESTLRKVARARAVPALTANAALPPELAAIIDKAMQRDPGKRQQSAMALATELRAFIRNHGHNVTTESLSRTMRQMFGDDYQRECARIEHYLAMPTPPAKIAMDNETAELETTRIVFSPMVGPEAMLAAGYDAEDEQTSADTPDTPDFPEMLGDDVGAIESTKADDPLSATIFNGVPAKAISIDSDSFEHLQPSLDDEATSADLPRVALDDEATTGDANHWSTARTRTFSADDHSNLESTRLFVHMSEGPTVVAGSLVPPIAVLQPDASIFEEKTKVYDAWPKVVRPVQPSSFTHEVTQHEASPDVSARTVEPSASVRLQKAITQVAPTPLAKKERKPPTPLVDDEPTHTRDAIETIETPDEDYVPLFTRSETITLLIAAMMGFLIMGASYLYALNVQLPDPDPIVQQQLLQQ